MINVFCCVAYVVDLFQSLVRGSPAALNDTELLASGAKGGGNRDDLWLWGALNLGCYISSCAPPLALSAAPSAPTLVNVTSEAPSQLHVSWVHGPGGRSSCQVTLYQESARTATSIMGPKADSTRFLGLTPGAKYKVEVISWAGPLYTAAPNVSAWTCEWGVKCTGGGDPWAH